MIRVCRLSGSWYGYYFSSMRSEARNVEELVEAGTPVILVDSLDDLDGIFDERPNVIMVEDE